MAQRYTDNGNAREGRPDAGGRSRGHDQPQQPAQARGRSRHWMHDDEPPRMDFAREGASDAQQWGWENDARVDQRSAGRHAGYGDYGTRDYAPLGSRSGQDPGEAGTRPRDFRDYGRGDYRGNVGPTGRGYPEANYGPTRYGEQYGSSGHEAPDATGDGGIGGQEFGRFEQDGEPGRSSHRGRGPRNYTRSDERIRELLCERLTDDPDIDASDVTVEVRDGEITLTGSLGDRRTKHRIEDIAESYAHGKHIDNRLQVKREERGSDDRSRLPGRYSTDG